MGAVGIDDHTAHSQRSTGRQWRDRHHGKYGKVHDSERDSMFIPECSRRLMAMTNIMKCL